MIYKGEDAEKRAALAVAEKMAAAAKTAPKGSGRDTVMALILDGEEKDTLSAHMRDIARESGEEFFKRDAANVDNSHCVVLLAAISAPFGLGHCGMCGFENCGKMAKAGANCAFNITDLGIAAGSAAAIAADNRIDNRILFSAGQAALRMNLFPADVRVCYGIPLATSSKSIFFDRDPANVML